MDDKPEYKTFTATKLPWHDEVMNMTVKDKEVVSEDTLMGEASRALDSASIGACSVETKPSTKKYKKHRKRGRPVMAKNKRLNPRQEAYCRYRVEKSMNKANAYRMAYGEATKAKDTYVYAYYLERKPHIVERMRQLLEDRAAIAKFYGGPEEALARWHDISQMARESGDLKALIRAQENIDKITGADKANIINNEVTKNMFLTQHNAEDKNEFQEQITKMLVQLQSAEHKAKPKGVKFGSENSFRGFSLDTPEEEMASLEDD